MYSSFLEIFKNKKKEDDYIKYYIPCYDVINNEIYFTEFFTEEIISNAVEITIDNEIDNLRERRKTNYFNSLYFKEGNIAKKTKEIGTEKLTDEDRKLLILKRQEKILLNELSLRFKKMLIISGFNENNYLSLNFYNYFSRPLYSHFFLPHNSKIYSFNNTSPISNSIMSYSFVDVFIDFHFDSLLGINLDKYLEINENDEENEYEYYENEKNLEESHKIQIYLQIKRNLSDLFKYSKKINLFYIIDTLIKDNIRLFEDSMNILLAKCEENQDNIDEIESRNMGQDNNNIINEEYENTLLELMDNFQKVKNDKTKCFILKVGGSEEYIYGEHSLAHYNFIRNKVRQKEVIKLILKSIPLIKINPPIFNYPPIIKVEKNKNITYYDLLALYKKYYPEHDIIFRLYKTSKKQKQRYLKKDLDRITYLTHFTESGDCDFPLIININTVNHLFSFIKWFNDDSYCHNKLILPYFNPLKAIRMNKKTNKFMKIIDIIKNAFLSKDEDNENGKDEDDDVNVFNEKTFKIYEKINKDNKEENEKLNNLKMDSFYQNEKYNSINTNLFNGSISQTNYSTIMEQMQNREQDPALLRGKIFSNEEEKITFFTHNTPSNSNLNYITNKYKSFLLENHPEELILPVFIRIKIYLLYGSYCMKKFQTQPYLIKDFIQINDKIIFNDKENNCLISHLPFETRIGIRIKGYDQKLSKGFILGSCQIPLYNDFGEMQSGIVDYVLWPNTKIFPRVNISTPFARKFVPKNKKKEMISRYEREINAEKRRLIREREKLYEEKENQLKNEEELKEKQKIIMGDNKSDNSKRTFDDENKEKKERDYEKEKNFEKERLNNDLLLINKIYNSMSKIALTLWEIIKIEKEENYLHQQKETLKKDKKKYYDNTNDGNNIDYKNRNTIYENPLGNNANNISLFNHNYVQIEELINIAEYPYISVKFPKFATPLIHSIPKQDTYRQYLNIKYKYLKNNEENDFEEIRKLFGNSQKDINNMIKDFGEDITKKYISRNESDQDRKKDLKKGKEEKFPTDIWKFLKKSFSTIVKILKKDPLEKLEEDEITSILICRDYICTIPSALELFLRAIDWRNPFEVSIAHSYLKKWKKLDYSDAISLLDARFPDVKVREYAVNTLREFSDDIIDNCMLLLCQCLLYETFLVNPLSDFLIERSLMNPALIGNDFIWYNRVNMENPLFEERLSTYSLQFLMLVGNKFIDDIFQQMKMNFFFQITEETILDQTKEKKKTGKEMVFLKKYYNNYIINKKFKFPLGPTFKCFKISQIDYDFIEYNTREPNVEYKKKLKIKIGNDYRQDAFIILILRIMDKFWLNNNLDLKLITYKVFPTEINMGYIEFIDSTSLNVIKNSSGVGGTLDREIIIKHLRCTSCDEYSSYEINFNDKTDNFIKSLAGYCVATCVLGVANRLTKKLLIKNNGIFFHVDFSRILGNFKKTFGFKKERSKFLLTPEMANVYIFQQKEVQFKKLCVKAFNILRNNATRLINLFIIMSTAGMPNFFRIADIEYIKQMLVLETPNDEDAGNYFIEEIKKCKNERLRQLDFLLQNLKLNSA